MSPRPVSLRPGMTSSKWMIGAMVREIRFHSLFRLIGTTGFTISVEISPSRFGPALVSQVNSIGTLIRAATGLASCLARASALDGASVWAAVVAATELSKKPQSRRACLEFIVFSGSG